VLPLLAAAVAAEEQQVAILSPPTPIPTLALL
jgi:hypothetical protein